MFQCFGLVNNGIPPFQVMMGCRCVKLVILSLRWYNASATWRSLCVPDSFINCPISSYNLLQREYEDPSHRLA